jgi:hypothetical protein
MTGFGKRGVEQRPVVERISPQLRGRDLEAEEKTFNSMTTLSSYLRWAAGLVILSVCAFGLVMMIMPFGALRFAIEYPIVQKLGYAGLLILGPLVVVLAVFRGVVDSYFAKKRYEAQRASGKNLWPLYGLCGGAGLIAFLIFSSQSPLGLFHSSQPIEASDPLLMTVAGYVGSGVLVARILDYFGIGLVND